MGAQKQTHLSILLNQSSLVAFRKACEECGESPDKVFGRWIKFSLAKWRRNKSGRPFHLLPGEVMARKRRATDTEPTYPAPPRLQFRLKRKEYLTLMAACKQRDVDVSSLMRRWVSALLKWHKEGWRIAVMAEPEGFKKDPRRLVLDGHLQIRIGKATVLRKLKDACRQEGIHHSHVMRTWISHILNQHRTGQDIEPPSDPASVPLPPRAVVLPRH